MTNKQIAKEYLRYRITNIMQRNVADDLKEEGYGDLSEKDVAEVINYLGNR
jgi:hypothetical protein